MKTEVKAAVAERKIVAWRNKVNNALVFHSRDDVGKRTGRYVVLADSLENNQPDVSVTLGQTWFENYSSELEPIYEGDSVIITF